MGDRVTDALERAVLQDPDNLDLACHLGEMLLEGGDAAGSLARAQEVLRADPAHGSGLDVAARAARAGGDEKAAAAYERLANALDADRESSAPDPPDLPTPVPARPGEELAEAEVVELHAVPGGRAADEADDLERPAVALDDIGGLDAVKARLRSSFLTPMQNPALTRQFGKSLRGGLLMYGPPGCGKTFVARAVAGELGARFYAVGISDVLDMYLGESERKLHEIFETARRNQPCVLFLDELDALGQKRSQLRASAGRTTVNQLLSEMDSVDRDNEGVFVLAATNHPWDVDTALRRPGRFDRVLAVMPPDPPARESILRLHLRERPVAESIDVAPVVAATDGFSGADLAYVCEVAAEAAMERSLEADELRPIDGSGLLEAARSVQPSTRPWFDVAYNYAMFANEGGQYDEILTYVKDHGLK